MLMPCILVVLLAVPLHQQKQPETRPAIRQQVKTVADIDIGVATDIDIAFLRSALVGTTDLDPAMRAGLIEIMLPYLENAASIGIENHRAPSKIVMVRRRDLRALWVLREVTGLNLPGPQTSEWRDEPVIEDYAWREDAAMLARAYFKGYVDARREASRGEPIRINGEQRDEFERLVSKPSTVFEAYGVLLNVLLNQGPLGKSITPLLEQLPPSARDDGRIHYLFDTGFAAVRITLLVDEQQVLRGIIVGG